MKTFAADKVANATYNDDRNHWMGKWEMEAKYGIDRVRKWITSGAMAKRPDPITGSEEDDMCEWAVPRSIEGTRSTDARGLGFFSEVLHFPKHNAVFNMCWLCKAGLNHNRYTDASDSAGWRPTIRRPSYLAELAAKGAPIPPLFKYVVGFQIQHVMIDVLHAIDQGVAAHIVGTIAGSSSV